MIFITVFAVISLALLMIVTIKVIDHIDDTYETLDEVPKKWWIVLSVAITYGIIAFSWLAAYGDKYLH